MKSAIQQAVTAAVLVCLILVAQADAHGRLIEPPSRSSMWRFGFGTERNYNDNQLSCGGFGVQWSQNGGRCGICGDPYNGPRENEAGGKYATGTIVRHYTEGETITVILDITKNHGGNFEFRICPNNDPSRRVTESCLNRYLLRQPNGQTRWKLSPSYGSTQFSINLVLPRGLTCSQCVLQWKWITASNWGCDAGGCGRGHGRQEQFYGCADVAITSSSSSGNFNPGSSFSRTTVGGNVPTQTPPAGGNTMNFIPSGGNNNNNNHNNYGFIPTVSHMKPTTSAKCEARTEWKTRYAWADQWCDTQCAAGNCPSQYCQDGCLQLYG